MKAKQMKKKQPRQGPAPVQPEQERKRPFWITGNGSFSKINVSVDQKHLRDKILAIQIMELLGPNYNECFVDKVERVIQRLREQSATTFEVEDILDYLLWDP